ncbi:MAG: trypsin-like serine protease [Bacteriovorax sp.]|nr:trypsin-like serine protease [Bacteriovorax sp.]
MLLKTILKLKKAAPNSSIPVPFLTEPSLLVANAPVTIAGFGNTLFIGDSDEPKSRILRSFETRILNPISPKNGMIEFHRNFDLLKTFDFQFSKTPGHPELDDNGGMAAGDSGGPAYITFSNKTYIIGIASGYKDSEGEIASYENVPTHSKWIQNVIKSF